MEPTSTARPSSRAPRRRGSESASRLAQRHRFWLAVGAITATAAAFLLHQLMAWPPHEDETLALFVGRDSLPGVVDARDARARRRAAPLRRSRGPSPTSASASARCGSSPRQPPSASLPLAAALGRRLVGRRAALLGTALLAGSWLFLFHGVYARMYGIFLLLSLL